MFVRAVAVAAMLAVAVPAWGQGVPAPAGTVLRRPTEMVERHIAGLKRALAITPAQQPQWDAFTAVMRQNAERMEAGVAERMARPATMTAVEDMRSYAKLERARADDMERLVGPFEALYQAMTPEQRASADKLFKDFQRRRRQ